MSTENKMQVEVQDKFNSTLENTDRNTEVDLVFCFDTTGSMSQYLEQVRNNIKDTCDKLLKALPKLNVGLCCVGDYCDQDNYVTSWQPLTHESKDIANFIYSTYGTAGGDFPEAYELFLQQASDIKWRKGSKRSIVFIGDAYPHQPSYTDQGIYWRHELQKLIDLKVKIYGVSCGTEDLFFKEISDLTGGLFLKLSDYKYVNDMFMAICYREGNMSSEFLAAHEHQVRKREGNHITAELDTVLNKLKGDDLKKLNVTGRTSYEGWFFKENDQGTQHQYSLVNDKWVKVVKKVKVVAIKKKPTSLKTISPKKKKGIKRKRTDNNTKSPVSPTKTKKDQLNMKLKSSQQANILAKQMLHQRTTQTSIEEVFNLKNIKSYKRQLRMVFKIYDCDNNGHINKAELAQVLKSMNKKASQEKIDLIFKEIDTSANGTIEKEEFVDYFVYRMKEKRFKKNDEKKMKQNGNQGYGRATQEPIRRSSTIFSFYTENAGESFKAGLNMDKFGNAIGDEHDLGQNGAYSSKIFLLTPEGFKIAKVKAALQSKGFEVTCSTNATTFMKSYHKYDQFWMVSGSDNGDTKLAKVLDSFHKSGKGISIFADGAGYKQVNPSLQQLLGITLNDTYEGKRVLEKGIATKKSHFAKHLLTSGILHLSEGDSLVRPQGTSNKAYCLATSSVGYPCVLVASVPYKGRILVNCSNQLSDDEFDNSAGIERFIKNQACWLKNVEHTLIKV